jgi:hypothetical protein
MKKTTWATGLAAVAALASAATLYASGARIEWSAPESQNAVRNVEGYRVSVHPAFASRASVRQAGGGEVTLYRQQGVYDLPAGKTEAPAHHVVRLEGGRYARDLGLAIDDPKHQVARITVELYGPGHQPGRHDPAVETFVVLDDVITCPPVCSGPDPAPAPPPANR